MFASLLNGIDYTLYYDISKTIQNEFVHITQAVEDVSNTIYGSESEK